ncbi:MAG: hypothetical protein ACKOUR_09840, partial [Planctomycetota bacterium]
HWTSRPLSSPRGGLEVRRTPDFQSVVISARRTGSPPYNGLPVRCDLRAADWKSVVQVPGAQVPGPFFSC